MKVQSLQDNATDSFASKSDVILDFLLYKKCEITMQMMDKDK